VTSEAFGLVHAGPVLLVGRENRVVPVIVAQHLGDILTPARVARHRGVQEQFIGHEEAIAAGDRLVAVKFGRIDLDEQNRAVRQRLTRFRRRGRRFVGIIVTQNRTTEVSKRGNCGNSSLKTSGKLAPMLLNLVCRETPCHAIAMPIPSIGLLRCRGFASNGSFGADICSLRTAF
jgi:hypothetical protein